MTLVHSRLTLRNEGWRVEQIWASEDPKTVQTVACLVIHRSLLAALCNLVKR
jgi:hypothetical protein